MSVSNLSLEMSMAVLRPYKIYTTPSNIHLNSDRYPPEVIPELSGCQQRVPSLSSSLTYNLRS